MRKLLIAGFAIASLTGVAYAQVGDQEAEAWLTCRHCISLKSVPGVSAPLVG